MKVTIHKGRRYEKIPAAAAYLGVTPRTIRNMIRDGRICAYCASSRLVRVDLDEIDAVMQRRFSTPKHF